MVSYFSMTDVIGPYPLLYGIYKLYLTPCIPTKHLWYEIQIYRGVFPAWQLEGSSCLLQLCLEHQRCTTMNYDPYVAPTTHISCMLVFTPCALYEYKCGQILKSWLSFCCSLHHTCYHWGCSQDICLTRDILMFGNLMGDRSADYTS